MPRLSSVAGWRGQGLRNRCEGQRWVQLRICTKAIKTIEKKGLQTMADEAGVNLWKLPFEDARPQRT